MSRQPTKRRTTPSQPVAMIAATAARAPGMAAALGRHVRVALGLAFAFAAASLAGAAIPPAERAALIDLYVSSDGAHWLDHAGWRNACDTDFASPGAEGARAVIRCDAMQSHVGGIAGVPGMSGRLPVTLTALTALHDLDVGDNALTGDLPDLSTLAQLARLLVGGNQFEGRLFAGSGALEHGGSVLCPNDFQRIDDAWRDSGIGASPWWRECLGRILALGFEAPREGHRQARGLSRAGSSS